MAQTKTEDRRPDHNQYKVVDVSVIPETRRISSMERPGFGPYRREIEKLVEDAYTDQSALARMLELRDVNFLGSYMRAKED